MKTTEKVLFVDDDANVLAAHRRMLRNDFEIDTAGGGEEALERLGAHGPYAVVVSDLRMPGLDGIRFLTEVRRRAPTAVRIMLTGYSNVENAIAAVNDGQIFHFLTKPCPPATLAAALRAGLEQHRLLRPRRSCSSRRWPAAWAFSPRCSASSTRRRSRGPRASGSWSAS
jgi:DNA-binding NtrC family response regulator